MDPFIRTPFLSGLQTGVDASFLYRILVRLIVPGERALWEDLMRQHHYLGWTGMVGKSLRYVAEADGQWVALLGWHAAVLKCRPRDRWIGWPPFLHYQRLHLIANNTRFLILPTIRIPNLASRILSLNLKRLSADWEAIHGHPLLLAETFVDPDRFTGACYRAANWQPLGLTRGFAKHQGTYWPHRRPKWVLVYPLHPQAQQRLSDPQITPRSTKMNPKTLTPKQLKSLRQQIRQLPDCRKRQGIRYAYRQVITTALAAVLCGAKSFVAIGEFAAMLTQAQLKHLGYRMNPKTGRYQPPSESTLRRVLSASDANLIDQQLGLWILAQSNASDPIAIDGKTLKGARRKDGSQVHLLSAFLHQQALTVAQVEVPKTTNEISCVAPLLDPINLRGRIVTADAMHTQRETVRYLVEDKGADYVLTVKGNQKTVHNDIAAISPDAFLPPHATCEKQHGRIEIRSIQTTTLLNHYLDFPSCGQVFKITRQRLERKTRKQTSEIVYGITSLTPQRATAAQLLSINRGHWSIENRSHYVRDMAYDEDRQQIREKAGPQIMATLRNIAVSLLRLIGYTNIASALRHMASHYRKALRLLGMRC